MLADMLKSEAKLISPTVHLPRNLSGETRRLVVRSYENYFEEAFRIVENPPPSNLIWFDNKFAQFNGQLHYRTKCTNCSHVSHVFEPFNHLLVNISGSSLVDSLESKCTPSKVEGYKCDFCRTETKALNKLNIWYSPKYLTVTINRFAGGMLKDMRDIDIPLKLDISPFTTLNRGVMSYQLCAIVCHRGRLKGGHYFSLTRYADRWFCCDDRSVSSSDLSVNRGEVYMLFYYAI